MPVADAPKRRPAQVHRRDTLDFSDYLELRRRRDRGDDSPETAALLAYLEEKLPVPFADAIPDMRTLADAPAAPPRELTREALRVAFAMREEFAAHGTTREGLYIDLPEGAGLKSWLDFMETERKLARLAREHLRELDAKLWAMLAGRRRMPTAPVPATGASDHQRLYERRPG